MLWPSAKRPGCKDLNTPRCHFTSFPAFVSPLLDSLFSFLLPQLVDSHPLWSFAVTKMCVFSAQEIKSPAGWMASLAVIPVRFRFMTSGSYIWHLPADSQLTARGSFTAKTSFPWLIERHRSVTSTYWAIINIKWISLQWCSGVLPESAQSNYIHALWKC